MFQRKHIVYFFTFLAVLGFGMYLLLPQESEFRSLGIVLMIFCLPMAMREAHKLARSSAPARMAPASPPAFGPREVHLTLEATFSSTVATARMQVDGDILELRCVLAVGSDGFTARLWRADGVSGPWPSEETIVMDAQLLVPGRALPRLPADTEAKVLLGNVLIGSVRVLGASEYRYPVSSASA